MERLKLTDVFHILLGFVTFVLFKNNFTAVIAVLIMLFYIFYQLIQEEDMKEKILDFVEFGLGVILGALATELTLLLIRYL
ncbi:MAG: hypothetical protein QW794_05550 [Thermosphaera sp.]